VAPAPSSRDRARCGPAGLAADEFAQRNQQFFRELRDAHRLSDTQAGAVREIFARSRGAQLLPSHAIRSARRSAGSEIARRACRTRTPSSSASAAPYMAPLSTSAPARAGVGVHRPVRISDILHLPVVWCEPARPRRSAKPWASACDGHEWEGLRGRPERPTTASTGARRAAGRGDRAHAQGAQPGSPPTHPGLRAGVPQAFVQPPATRAPAAPAAAGAAAVPTPFPRARSRTVAVPSASRPGQRGTLNLPLDENQLPAAAAAARLHRDEGLVRSTTSAPTGLVRWRPLLARQPRDDAQPRELPP
jgi:hypothetical protein